jgi:nucleotide-binding universal stress UspA family protein
MLPLHPDRVSMGKPGSPRRSHPGAHMYKSILLAYDGSREGAMALREGALLAKTCGAKVVLLSVIPSSTATTEFAAGVGGTLVDHIDGYKEQLKRAVAWMAERGFEPVPKLVIGDPAQSIGAVAKEISADLVVVGHGHKNFLSRWWSGSTKASLSDHVGCSILIACNATSDDAFESAKREDA